MIVCRSQAEIARMRTANQLVADASARVGVRVICCHRSRRASIGMESALAIALATAWVS